MSREQEVRAATDRFYAALKSYVHGDPAPMLDVWWQGGPVTNGHPLHGWARGWDEVHATWSRVDLVFDVSNFAIEDVSVHIHGDFAYMIGVERITLGKHGKTSEFYSPVTNIFRYVDGAWRMVHHHVDVSHELQRFVAEANNVR